MKTIDLEHPEYLAKKSVWQTYRDLYAGGQQLKANASNYLTARQKEPMDVYSERLSRVFYENYLGSIIDWYAATLFRREPLILVEGDDEAGRKFTGEFAEDCDHRGSTLTDLFRRRMIDTLVCGSSYVLVDFPRPSGRVKNRAVEEASGAARAYLVEYSPEQVINWSHDERGNFESVVVRTEAPSRSATDLGKWTTETRWTYYDKEFYRSYRQAGGLKASTPIEMVASGRHALAEQRRVPLFKMEAPKGLWLANKAGLLQLEHFNKSNALAWALTMGLFAMPVVYTEREWNQIVGESYYIQLGPDDKFGWTEPEGHVYQIASDNLKRLQEEIYRVCYLMSQAGGPGASRTSQSGLSKQRDFAITQEVLRAYGDIVKDTMKSVLRAVAAARMDRISIDVSGLDDFDIGDFSAELGDAERLLRLGIESPTLRKQIFKKLAFKYLCDVRQEMKDRIAAEIDEAVDKSTE